MAVTLPSVYQDGTATIAANGKTVTGQGTLWTAAILPGDFWGVHKGYAVRILSVDSDTQLTLANAWPGAAQTAAAYEIMLQSDNARMQETSRRLLQQLSNGNVAAFTSLLGGANKLPYFTGSGSMDVLSMSTQGKAILSAASQADIQLALGMGSAAFKNVGTSGDAVPNLNAANTWSAGQLYGGGLYGSAIYSSTGVGSGNFIDGRKGAAPSTSVARWRQWLGNPDTETGVNAGSNYVLERFNDAGTSIGQAIVVNRATGVMTLGAPLPVGSGGTGVGTIAAFQTALGLGTAAYKNLGTSGDAVPLLNTANTWSGDQTLDRSAANFHAVFNMTTTAGFTTVIGGMRKVSGADSLRWQVQVGSAEAETGANAGTNFNIARFTDAGAFAGNALTISRATGVTTLQAPLPVGSGGTGVSSITALQTALGLGTAAYRNIGTSGTAVALLDGQNTWSGAAVFANAGNNVIIEGGTSGNGILAFRRNGLARWNLIMSPGDTGSGNGGSDFQLQRRADDGSFIDAPMQVQRSDGTVIFNRFVSMTARARVVGNATIDGAAATDRVLFLTTNNVNRWTMSANSDGETGANAGSNLLIGRWSDNGTFLGNILTASRANGLVTLSSLSTASATISTLINPSIVDASNRAGVRFDQSLVATGTVKNIRVPNGDTALSTWEYIGDFSGTNVTSVAATNLAPFRRLRMRGYLIFTNSGSTAGWQCSTDNGATWAGGNNDWSYTAMTAANAGPTTSAGGGPGSLAILAGGIDGGGDLGMQFEIEFEYFNTPARVRTLGRGSYWSAGSMIHNSVANVSASQVAQNAVRLIATGPFSGSFLLEGVRG